MAPCSLESSLGAEIDTSFEKRIIHIQLFGPPAVRIRQYRVEQSSLK